MLELSLLPAIDTKVALTNRATATLPDGCTTPDDSAIDESFVTGDDLAPIVISTQPQFLLQHLVQNPPNSLSEKLTDQFAVRLQEEKPNVSCERVLRTRGKIENRISRIIELLTSGNDVRRAGERTFEIEKILDLHTNEPDSNNHLPISEFYNRLRYLEVLASLKSHRIDINSELVINSFQRYQAANGKYRNLADALVNLLPGQRDDNYIFRAIVISFLESVELYRPEERRAAINFIRNLTTLAAHEVEGVERVLLNAFETKHGFINGYFREAFTAVTLTEHGFTILRMSVRELEKEGQKVDLIDSDGIEREIDIIAKKRFHGEEITFSIEVKPRISNVNEANDRNGQLNALIEFAKQFNFVPVVVISTMKQSFWKNGTVRETSYVEPDRDGAIKLLIEHTGLLIWDEKGGNIVKETAVQRAKTEQEPPDSSSLVA